MPSKPESENKKYPTTVRFDEEDFPELKKWRVGGKYKITLEVEQIGMSKGEEYGPIDGSSKKPLVSGTFKVISACPEGSSPIKDAKRPNRLSDALKRRM